MATDVNLLPRLAAGVTAQDVDGDVLTYDGHTLSRLTGRSATVARLVDGTRSVTAIVRACGLAEADVLEELDGLVTAGVTEPGSPVPDDGFRRPDHVGVCKDGEQVILLDLRDGERHVLSASAAAIWEALMETGSLGSAVAGLEAAYPDAPELGGDVAAFVSGLETQGLVERVR